MSDNSICKSCTSRSPVCGTGKPCFRKEENVAPLELGASLDPAIMREYLIRYMGDELFANKFMECIDLLKVKNADYSQGEQKGDRIAAFRRIARDINITMEQAWAVFCQKHWGAVMKYVKDGIVESETIDSRISDIINYMVLLSAIISDKRKVDLA